MAEENDRLLNTLKEALKTLNSLIYPNPMEKELIANFKQAIAESEAK